MADPLPAVADRPATAASASRPSSPTLARVLAGELCSGCGLCAGISHGRIALETVAPGYTRPRQSAALDAATERTIARACPGATVAPWVGPRARGRAWSDAPQVDPYWGPFHSCETGHATDEEVRFVGSSGGVASALLIGAIESGAVDAALHVAADPARPTRNVLHWSTTREEVLAGAGSRYAASSPLAEIDAALASGRRFAFVGKPCDVSALRQLALTDPRVDAQVPLKIAFFCGGLPSHAGADRIVRAMGLDPAQLARFRYRGHGWPGTARADLADGTHGEMSYADSWGGHLSKEVQFRCKICPDAVGGVADVAVADAWYEDASGYPSFAEQDGRSLVMARTPAGVAALAAARAAGAIVTAPLPVGEIVRMQGSQANRKRLVIPRLAACALLFQPRPDVRGLATGAAMRRGTLGTALRNLVGTARRIILGRR
ncbi:Coenzyme F420 hydrogenase/dehydrogenase, beta subunit C-terminal domain [Sphingomonas corticis]|jgi:coenzyme F420 hydrogenase subunit beta|uniref:Coenzyme F420 hydrogenase n=1 Tax=Sphingomonas corticis TaxID=2722791 RepID=A0ABX1CKZ8_9SPHN|nr:Coenzyme F420 hydrogenase/dehydrogenase, beta subunit C-terminal domain [Sphingomonas corticis]NJR77851.1 hypothetical protein [Sphingomonas corticis]